MVNVWDSSYQNEQQRSIRNDRRNFKYKELKHELKGEKNVKISSINNDSIDLSVNNSK